jgi:hypothetical protein
MQIERRFIKGGSVRAKTGEKPGITGIASVYTQQYDAGYFVETIKRGAFDRALTEKQDVRCLFNHNVDNLLGRTKSETLRLADSEEGLSYDCDTDINTTVGRDVQAMIARGDLDGCSFSFNVLADNWRDEFDESGKWVKSYREITDLDLFDVGPVTFPAYTDTSVKVRSQWPDGIPAEIRSHIPELRAEDEQTKKVDGEDLTRDCFLLVGDPDKTDTWELPWKFSTAAKTKSHLRDALARFNQVEGFSDELLAKAWTKLLMLCDHYGIDVADKTQPRSARSEERCECDCDPCQAANCEDCTVPDCDDPNCSCEASQDRSLLLRARVHMHAPGPQLVV